MPRYVKSSRPDQQQRNASKPIKASVKAASEQPSVAMLASLGIKVRDFAYESKLPPVQPIYRHPRQIQPAVVRTILKRQWTETGENDPLSQSSSQPETSQKKLERTSTEPVISEPSARTLGSMTIDDSEHDSPPIDSQQMPPPIFKSQESEPYIDTPLLTPKGSFQWPIPDTSNVPASPIPASQSDTGSQATAPEAPSFSQLRFFQISNPSSPLASALSLASINDGLSSTKSITSTPPRQRRGKPTAGLDQRSIIDPTHDAYTPPTNPRVVAMRYHLRTRSAPPSSPFSSTKSSSRLRGLRPRGAVIPASRPHCASMQSSHSRAKPKGESSTPSSRILLRRTVTNGQNKRRRTS